MKLTRFLEVATLVGSLILSACDSVPGKKTIPDVHFATTPHKVVKEMLKLAEVGTDDVVYDLGSGDGRIVIAAARDFGARGVGVELDKELVAESTKNARDAGVGERVKFLEEDFFAVNLRDATVVALYLLPELNVRLMPKFLSEMKPGARIVSHRWDMGKWRPDMTLKAYGTVIHLWFIPARVEGTWRLTLRGEKESRQYTLAVKQDFQRIKATLRDEKRRYSIEDAYVQGVEMAISVSDAVRGKIFVLNLEGVVNGDTIEGTAFIREGEVPFAVPYSMKGERIER